MVRQALGGRRRPRNARRLAGDRLAGFTARSPGRHRRDHPDATAAVLFTSGTTGEPKGVVLSHRNLLSNIRQVEVQFEPRVEEMVRGAAGVDEHALVVTGLPDPRRGERLVVLDADVGGKSREEISRILIERSIPELWLPAVSDYIKVEVIPRLASGKVDLGLVRRVVQAKASS